MKFVWSLVFVLAGAAVQARQIEHHRFQHEGRCLRIEVLDDDLLHFEIYQRTEPGKETKCLPENDMIWVTPMVDGYNVNEKDKLYFTPEKRGPYKVVYKEGYQGPDPDQYRKHGDGVETSELRVFIYDESQCIKVFDKKRGKDLAQICARDLTRADKRLEIAKYGMKNFYGLGNLFTRADDANGDWKGIVWDVPKKRNHPGNIRGPEYHHGPNDEPSTPSTSQFPMVYALGEGNLNYGLFFDNSGRMTMDFSRADDYVYETYGDELRFFVLTGDSLKDLRSDLLQLTGKPPMPPKAQYGHWSSKFGFENWAQAWTEAEGLRKAQTPLDGLALDLQWFGAKFGDPNVFRMGVLQFKEPEFENASAKIKEFYEKWGVQFMPIEESYVDDRLAEHKALASFKYRMETPGFNHITDDQGCFLARTSADGFEPAVVNVDFKTALLDPRAKLWWGRGGMLDHSNGHARYFWHQLKRRARSEDGIFSHWLDLGEPEMFFEYAYYYGFPELYREWTDHEGKLKQNIVQKHGDIHNFYNLFWAMGIHEGYHNAKNADSLRPTLKKMFGKDYDFGPRHWTLSRAGTVGSQRYGGMWSGDIGGNFASLNGHLNSQMHMSLLGMDSYTADAGGFWHAKQGRDANDPYDRMLYKQWFAIASLIDLPLRPHGWADGENLSYGAHVRGDVDSNRANVRRRYELIPYVYSLSWRAHTNGEAVFPPLVYHFQDDMTVRENATEKMIGPSLMTRIVVDWRGVGRAQASEAPVYLPKGTWVDYESLNWHDSNGGITGKIPFFRKERVPESAPAGTYYFFNPLFARAGAIIPKMYVDEKTMNSLGKRWGEDPRDELVVKVFADGRESDFTLYEDDGVSQGYLHDQRLLTTLRQQSFGDKATVTIEGTKGQGYTGMNERRKNAVELVLRDRQVARVLLNGNLQAKCDEDAIRKYGPEARQCWYQAENLVKVRTEALSVRDTKHLEFQFE